MSQDTFVFHRSWMDAVCELDESAQLAVLKGIIAYNLDGTEPEDPMARFAFKLLKPMIDKQNQKRSSRQEAGRTGGLANAKQTEANESKREANRSKREANVKQTEANESNGEANVKLNVKLENCKIEKLENEVGNVEQSPTDDRYPYQEVVAYLNKKAGKSFQSNSKNTKSHIRARFDEGYTLTDFKKVIDNKVAEWKDDPRMNAFLRPNTLFSAGHFEEYLNQKPVRVKNQFGTFHQRDYDFEALDAQIFEQQFGGGSG